METTKTGTQRRPGCSGRSRPTHSGHRRRFSGAALVLAALCAPTPLYAGDWYVDARTGSDSNDGRAPATAWLTITHALDVIASQPLATDTLNVAPGIYSPRLGEVFPLHPRPLLRILGTEGSAQTVLDGSASEVVAYEATGVDAFDFRSGAEGLTLRGSSSGIRVRVTAGNASPAFRDLVIEDMAGAGIVVEVAPGLTIPATTSTTFERLVVERCDTGIVIGASGSGWLTSTTKMTVTDSVVRASRTDGIRITVSGPTAGVGLALNRCRILENAGNGVTSNNLGNLTGAGVTATSCLFARNQGSGAYGYGTSTVYVSSFFRFDACTFADNAVAGIRAVLNQNTRLDNTILARNGDDLSLDQAPDAFWSDSADGDLLAFATCIAADPLFVAPAQGDFRLRFGSPCVDAGDPASDAEFDLLGHVRPYDGDLDTIERRDMGAFEFEPLHLDGIAQLGQPLRFEFWGAPGAHSRLLFSRQPPSRGRGTSFGELWLRRDTLLVLGELVIGAAPPAVRVRTVPNDPALIGRTFSFQTLTDSNQAPRGMALSNAVSYVIAP